MGKRPPESLVQRTTLYLRGLGKVPRGRLDQDYSLSPSSPSLQVRGPLPAEAPRIHGLQQHRLPLPHSCQQMARSPHGKCHPPPLRAPGRVSDRGVEPQEGPTQTRRWEERVEYQLTCAQRVGTEPSTFPSPPGICPESHLLHITAWGLYI